MKIVKILLLTVLLDIAAFGAPAIQREVLFTQPDGTYFYGKLKGDASFHWIESNGDVVLYNPKDKYYYKAIVDPDRGLLVGSKKAKSFTGKYSGVQKAAAVQKQLPVEIKEHLQLLYKKAKHSNGPR
jgi:hypothetical protein